MGVLTGSTGGEFVKQADSLAAVGGQASVYLRFGMISDATITDDGAHLDDVQVLCPGLTYDSTDFDFLQGTSMAAPHVTGTAALMWADTPGAPVAEIRQRLLANVDALPSLAGRTVTGGRLNAAKAVESAPPAVVATQPATAITRTSATLNGTVNPRWHAISYRFEYGTTTSYGQSTTVQNAGTGNTAVAVNAPLTALEPAPPTTIGWSPPSRTEPSPATTPSSPPWPFPRGHLPAGHRHHHHHGGCERHGRPARSGHHVPVRVRHHDGLRPLHRVGRRRCRPRPGGGQRPAGRPRARHDLPLPAGRTNAGGTTFGDDAQFTTAPLGEPVAALAPATMILRTSATLNGTVDPAGKSTSYRFQYGTTTAYGASVVGDVGAGTGPQPVSAALSGLAASTTYHFRLIATNTDGTTISDDAQFTTASVGPPAVALAATTVTKRGATLNGKVDPRGLATTYHFEYGTTTAYGTSTPAANVLPTRASWRSAPR